MKKKYKILSQNPLLVLCGPTAVGKTELSLQIAERFFCEIVGADSMQVYRHMDIGTAKPTSIERTLLPHHLIDIVDPDEDFTLGMFVKTASTAINEIYTNHNIPLLTGGTGLYIKGLVDGVFDEESFEKAKDNKNNQKNTTSFKQELQKRITEEGNVELHKELSEVDPDSALRIHPNDTQRIIRGLEIYYSTGIPWSRHLAKQKTETSRYKTLKICLTRPREELYKRIDQRVLQMVKEGLLDEVKQLLDMGYHKNLKSMQSIGYRHMVNFIEGVWTWEQALELLARDTRRYAKRQFTWFKNDSQIIWHDVKEQDTIFREIETFLNQMEP